MTNTDAYTAFKHGVDLLRNGYPSDAMPFFRTAAEAQEQNPLYLSFLGLSVARAQGKWDAALTLCEAAVRLKRDEPQLYLNLASVYVSASRREKAVEVLDSALKRFGRNAPVERERNKLGKRAGPVLPFLPREHSLNRTLGRLRHRALRRFHKTEPLASRGKRA
jgi:Flp pilus assembly protein TadD